MFHHLIAFFHTRQIVVVVVFFLSQFDFVLFGFRAIRPPPAALEAGAPTRVAPFSAAPSLQFTSSFARSRPGEELVRRQRVEESESQAGRQRHGSEPEDECQRTG